MFWELTNQIMKCCDDIEYRSNVLFHGQHGETHSWQCLKKQLPADFICFTKLERV